MNSITKYFLLYFTPLVYWGFYHYVGFNPTYAVYVVMIYTVLLFLYLLPNIFKRKYGRSSYSWYMKGIICIILVSMLMAFIFWGQSMLLTYRATVYQFVFLYYFILVKFKVTQKEITTIILIFSALYSLLWIIALLNAPFPVFSEDEEIDDTRGAFRLIINSLDIIILLYCYSLVWIRQKKHPGFALVALLICALLILSSLTRSIMFSVIVVTSLFLLFKARRRTQVLLVLLLLFTYPAINSWLENNDTYNSISELNESQLSDFENSSTRAPEYRIGFLEFKRNPITFVLGSGMAHGNSSYGKYVQNLHDRFYFDRSDAGYPAIFVTYGLVGLFLFIGLFIKAFFDKSDGGGLNQYKMYIIIIAAVNVLQDATSWYAIATCMAVYMLEKERLLKLTSRVSPPKEDHYRQLESVVE